MGGDWGFGGLRWAGFVRVEGIFNSRLPHTGVTGGSGLVKVLAWCFYSLVFSLIS